MKKLILIMLLALFGLGISQSMAQVILPPTPLSDDCIDLTDPLNVVPGVEYTYQVNIPHPPGTKSYQWFVTQDTKFIEEGAIIANEEPIDGSGPILASGDLHYNTLQEYDSINLVWHSFMLDPLEYVFVVIYVENEDNCTTNNLKVYRIKPIHAFTLDIANVDMSGTPELGADSLAQCFSDVQEAEFDPSIPDDGGIVYDFGADSMYFVVAAANFSGRYQLYAQVDDLINPSPEGFLGQEATIYWSYTIVGLETATGLPIVNDTPITLADTVDAQSANGTVGPEGEMIYIKLLIKHNSFEGANSVDTYAYDLRVDGLLFGTDGVTLLDPTIYGDIHHEDPCEVDLFANDLAVQILKARPTVESVSPAPPDGFLPIAP